MEVEVNRLLCESTVRCFSFTSQAVKLGYFHYRQSPTDFYMIKTKTYSLKNKVGY